MDRYERISTLHRLLKSAHYPIPLARLREELECSRATLYRDVAFLRDALGAPVESAGGDQAAFRYEVGEGERFELPGLWLTSDELSALLALNELIDRSGTGVLAGALTPLRKRIEGLLSNREGNDEPLPIERIRVIPWGERKLSQQVFRIVAGSVLKRHQLRFRYRARTTNTDSRRTVSPQRLTHYRDNWYLDVWDHDREALRSFAVDRIVEPQALDAAAIDVAENDLNELLASSYGIFAGNPKAWATIRFSQHAARWVADEHWHSQQRGEWLPDGRYELQVPYSNSRELLMDVLKYGPDAEIVSPLPLREEMKILLQLAMSGYQPSA
jgi:predicted DNA-binding transcriptional regulator YafY